MTSASACRWIHSNLAGSSNEGCWTAQSLAGPDVIGHGPYINAVPAVSGSHAAPTQQGSLTSSSCLQVDPQPSGGQQA